MKAWPLLAICIIQILLLLAHWFVFSTWIAAWPWLHHPFAHELRITMLILAFSFVAASLLAFRFSNVAVRFLYWAASVWLGFMNFFLWAALLCQIAWLALGLAHSPAFARPIVASSLFGIASLLAVYGLINARILRIRKIKVQLPNLPPSWKGRRAVLFSDLHLGAINGVRFCRRVAAKACSLQPDIVFIPGDLFDGTKAEIDRVIAPLKELTPPLGIYFSSGNHEEFSDPSHYYEAIRQAGIRVLHGEHVMVDGVQIAGVDYHSSSSPLRMKTVLDNMKIDLARPAILLNHAPARLPTVEQAGFGLQLSGHTHGGQFLPFTWITRSIYGVFTTGLHRFGTLQVYTSTGAGSWGPPMRAGTQPEMVLIAFE